MEKPTYLDPEFGARMRLLKSLLDKDPEKLAEAERDKLLSTLKQLPGLLTCKKLDTNE